MCGLVKSVIMKLRMLLWATSSIQAQSGNLRAYVTDKTIGMWKAAQRY